MFCQKDPPLRLRPGSLLVPLFLPGRHRVGRLLSPIKALSMRRRLLPYTQPAMPSRVDLGERAAKALAVSACFSPFGGMVRSNSLSKIAKSRVGVIRLLFSTILAGMFLPSGWGDGTVFKITSRHADRAPQLCRIWD
jgi:hypothetical protein